MVFQPPANRCPTWPHSFVCDGNMYRAIFAGSYLKVIKAIGAIAVQLEWTVNQAAGKPFLQMNQALSLEFFEALFQNLLRFCSEPLKIIKSTMETYEEGGMLEEKFRWKKVNHFVDASGECGTVKQALTEVERLVDSADKVLNRVYAELNFDKYLVKDLPTKGKFITRPPREILLELALLWKSLSPQGPAIKRVSALRTSSDVENAFGLCFNTQFKGPLFPDGKYVQDALVPNMFFICLHKDKNQTKNKWIVGSTVPRCGDFTWATDVCKRVRETRLGGQQIANSKDAQILAETLENSLDASYDLVRRRQRVIGGFRSKPTNLALVSRSMDSGIALDDKLKPESLCYRCQIIHRYEQLASAGFSTSYLEDHLENWQWKRHPIETAHACAESVASLCCGMYEVERGRVAHG